MTLYILTIAVAAIAFMLGFITINLQDAIRWIWEHGWESIVIFSGAIAAAWKWFYETRKSDKATGWQSELEITKARNDIIETLQNQMDKMAERQVIKDAQIDELEEKVSYLMRYVRAVELECPECHLKASAQLPKS